MNVLTSEKLQRQVQLLPSMSSNVTRLLCLLQDKDVTISMLATEIGHDQGMTVDVLRIANSPFYGMSTCIDNIADAITLLGLSTLECIIIAAGVMSQFPRCDDKNFNSQSFWLHAIGTGSCARALAPYVNLNADKAFTVGLLHDIGKVVLAAYFNEDFARVLAYRDEQDCLIRDAEQSVLGFDHTRIGAMVAQQWKLPSTVVNSIAGHHNVFAHADPFADLVHVADILCRGLDIGHGGDDLIPELDLNALTRLGLEFTELEQSLAEIENLSGYADMFLDTNI